MPAWLAQYRGSILLFVPTTLVSAYYSGLVTQRSADYQVRVYFLGLAGYMFVSRTMFAINAREGDFPEYYASKPHSDNLSSSLLLWVPDKLSDALK